MLDKADLIKDILHNRNLIKATCNDLKGILDRLSNEVIDNDVMAEFDNLCYMQDIINDRAREISNVIQEMILIDNYIRKFK